jgi:hypothetical protein
VLTNGFRKLIVLFPRGDVSWKFQSAGGSPLVRHSPYNPLANLWAEAMGSQSSLLKGESTWIDRNTATSNSATKVRLARLQYSGNWDPEPGGWMRLANLLHNTGEAELQNDAIPLEKLTNQYPLAHLTGTTTIRLSVAEQATLRSYLDHGGLLLFDAAGGSTEAASSIQTILSGMYPTAQNEPLPIDHPVYTGAYPGGTRIDSVTYRATDRLQPTRLPRLRGFTVDGKLLAIISNEDISGGLVGYPSSNFAGYSPQSAAELARAILLWRNSKTP